MTESRSRETTDYINTLTLSVRTSSGEHEVAGAVIGNRGLRLVRIDGYRVEAVPEGYFLMLHNRDVPGVVGAVGTMLGQAGINIAGLELGRDRAGGMALSLFEVDGAVPAEVLESLKTIPAITLGRAAQALEWVRTDFSSRRPKRWRRAASPRVGCDAMKTVAVVGTQWGDEGKGKIVDMLAADADVVVRFQGGNNAAHTLVVDGEKFILRLVPAGALHPGKACVIGNGTVVDPIALAEEIAELKRPRPFADDTLLKISYDAHMVMPYHRAIDRAREARAGKRAIGTTGFGIGPAYEDKMARVGLRFDDLHQFRTLSREARAQYRRQERYLNAVLKAKPIKGRRRSIDQMKRVRAPDAAVSMRHRRLPGRGGRRRQARPVRGRARHDARHRSRHLSVRDLVELHRERGFFRRAASLRADSTRCSASARPTRRASARGRFPSEIKGCARQSAARRGRGVRQRDRAAAADRMVRRGARALRGAAQRDVGARAHQARRADRDRSDEDLRRLSTRSASATTRCRPGAPCSISARPIYEEMPGWSESLSGARALSDLPPNARRYLERISELAGVRLAMVGVGEAREATIVLSNPFLV